VIDLIQKLNARVKLLQKGEEIRYDLHHVVFGQLQSVSPFREQVRVAVAAVHWLLFAKRFIHSQREKVQNELAAE
jgi:hypothetical protein